MTKQAELNLTTRRTRKAVLLDEMELVKPSRKLGAWIAAASPVASTGRPPLVHETRIRRHFLQQWFGLSGLVMEKALFETPLYRDFADPSRAARVLYRMSILRCRHLLGENNISLPTLAIVNSTPAAKGPLLNSGSTIDATLFAEPSPTENSSCERDPKIHHTRKCNQWHFGMKVQVGAEAGWGQVRTLEGTAAIANDVMQASFPVHDQEADEFALLSYRGVAKREETQGIEAKWHVAMRPGNQHALSSSTPMDCVLDELEHVKAITRAKVEHPCWDIKRQFVFVTVRFCGAGEKHRAVAHAVRPLQSVDDAAPAFTEGSGKSASAARPWAF